MNYPVEGNKRKFQANTMMEKMGFRDDDLRCPKHDEMSLILGDERLCFRMASKSLEIRAFCYDAIEKAEKNCIGFYCESTNTFYSGFIDRDNCISTDIVGLSLEHPVCKGEGRYKAIVGYLDCFLQFRMRFEIESSAFKIRPRNCDDELHKGKRTLYAYANICIEAKPSLTNPMETLRQIKTYKEFFNTPPHDRSQLLHEITYFLLWCPSVDAKMKALFENDPMISVEDITIDSLLNG